MNKLLYLEFRQVYNYIRHSLRTPKRLIPILFSVLWFVQFFGFQAFRAGRYPHTPYPHSAGTPIGVSTQAFETAGTIVTMILAGIALIWIALSLVFNFISFRASDLDFLFPTPVHRKTLVLWKLMRIYVRTISVEIIWLLVFIPVQLMIWDEEIPFASKMLPLFFTALIAFALLVIFVVNLGTALNLYLSSEGRNRRIRQIAKMAVFLTASLSIFCLIFNLMDFAMYFDNFDYGSIRPSVLGLILSPIKWGVDLGLSPLVGLNGVICLEFLGLVAITAASFLPITHGRYDFYERYIPVRTAPSTAPKADQAALRRAKPRWILRPFGRGATAIIWLNLLLALRSAGAAFIVLLAAAFLLLAVPWYVTVASGLETSTSLADAPSVIVSFIMIAMAGFGSPLMLQQFREAMKQANTTKPMPIPAWQMVAVQGVHGTIIATVISWAVTLMVLGFYGIPSETPLLLAALALPAVVYASACAQSFVAVLYPRWEDKFEQQIGYLLISVTNLFAIGPSIAAAIGLSIIRVPMPLIVIVVWLISAGIAILGILGGAAIYSRHDPTADN